MEVGAGGSPWAGWAWPDSYKTKQHGSQCARKVSWCLLHSPAAPDKAPAWRSQHHPIPQCCHTNSHFRCCIFG